MTQSPRQPGAGSRTASQQDTTQSPIAFRSPGAGQSQLTEDNIGQEYAAIKLEMLRLKERRRQLEEKRRELRRQQTNPSSVGSAAGVGNASQRSASAHSATRSIIHDPPGATHIQPIID